jgi:CBS domain-containing protein
MKVSEVMSRHVDIVAGDATLSDAAKMMSKYDVGSLPVKKGSQLVGIITDRDIVVRALSQDKDPAHTTVNEIMSLDPEFCTEEESLEQVAEQMKARQIRRLPVLDDNKNIIGMVSLSDILVKGPKKTGCEVAGKVSEPFKAFERV